MGRRPVGKEGQMSDLDQLWDRQPHGGVTWYDSLTDEQRAFIDEVAEVSRAKHRYPVWAAVWRAFRAEWPDAAPSVNTVKATIQRLVSL